MLVRHFPAQAFTAAQHKREPQPASGAFAGPAHAPFKHACAHIRIDDGSGIRQKHFIRTELQQNAALFGIATCVVEQIVQNHSGQLRTSQNRQPVGQQTGKGDRPPSQALPDLHLLLPRQHTQIERPELQLLRLTRKKQHCTDHRRHGRNSPLHSAHNRKQFVISAQAAFQNLHPALQYGQRSAQLMADVPSEQLFPVQKLSQGLLPPCESPRQITDLVIPRTQ